MATVLVEESRWLLAKLPPMKTIMSLVQLPSYSSSMRIGTAISDPYLGFARPLQNVSTPSELDQVLVDHTPGAVLLGWPIIHTPHHHDVPASPNNKKNHDPQRQKHHHPLWTHPDYRCILQRHVPLAHNMDPATMITWDQA